MKTCDALIFITGSGLAGMRSRIGSFKNEEKCDVN